LVEIYPLDVMLDVDTEYESEKRTCLVVREFGTNSTSDAILYINGKPTGGIIDVMSPLYKRTANFLGPLCLGDLYYVIPPETKFKFTGESGSFMRLKGDLLRLAVGEAVPSPHMTRYDRQFDHYLTHKSGTRAFAAATTWGPDVEYEIVSIEPTTIETFKLNNVVMGSTTGITYSEGDVAIRFWLDGAPVIPYWAVNKVGAIDILSAPRPPAEGTELTPFTLEKWPIIVEGDHVAKLNLRNISGGDLSIAAGGALTITAIVEYIRRG